jgi:hypothetical protein
MKWHKEAGIRHVCHCNCDAFVKKGVGRGGADLQLCLVSAKAPRKNVVFFVDTSAQHEVHSTNKWLQQLVCNKAATYETAWSAYQCCSTRAERSSCLRTATTDKFPHDL